MKDENKIYCIVVDGKMSKAQTKEFWESWSKLTRIPLKLVFGPKYCLLHAWLDSF